MLVGCEVSTIVMALLEPSCIVKEDAESVTEDVSLSVIVTTTDGGEASGYPYTEPETVKSTEVVCVDS